MENRVLAARQIRIETLLDQLHSLYDLGLDYIDIHGEQGEHVDSVVFSFNKEYMGKEFQHQFDEIFKDVLKEEDGSVEQKLTDEDIDNLLR